MIQPYKVIMDDGRFLYLEAQSAGNAIMKALKAYREHRVVECWLGDTSNSDDPWKGGKINFDIPPHQPLPKHVPKKRIRPATELFDDATILRESDLAKSKHDQP